LTIDPLRGVAEPEVDPAAQPGELLQDGAADVLGDAGEDGGFVDDDAALADHLAHGFRGLDHRGEVGPVPVVHRGRHRDDEEVRPAQVLELAGHGEGGRLQRLRRHFPGPVNALPELGDLGLVDVEAQGARVLLGEFQGQRQSNVSETHDSNLHDTPSRMKDRRASG